MWKVDRNIQESNTSAAVQVMARVVAKGVDDTSAGTHWQRFWSRVLLIAASVFASAILAYMIAVALLQEEAPLRLGRHQSGSSSHCTRLIRHRLESERPKPLCQVGALLPPQPGVSQQVDSRPGQQSRSDQGNYHHGPPLGS
jgi:hypothetical protein